MKRNIVFVILLLFSIQLVAQTQHGYVKTKSRFGSNGQVIAGIRLPGATVRFKDKTVVSQASGTFSFVVSNKKYTVVDIQKKDYQLYDREQLMEYAYSSNPLVLVLEKPDDRESDKLMAQKKISRTLRSQLQQREEELERLKEENKITQQEYQRLSKQLYSDEKKNQDLIEKMAERYASMDFDQMDEENRKIKTLILNGELQKADSIINSKGSLEDRIASYKAHMEANKQEEQELVERKERLQKSKEVENLTLNEIAEDCMNKHEMYKLRCMFDSAAYYIQMRAELDTMNFVWQTEVALYLQQQNNFEFSEKYGVRSINVLKKWVKMNPKLFEKLLAASYGNLANLYHDTHRFAENEELYKSAIAVYERLAKGRPQTYEENLAAPYINLANLYRDTHRFAESEELYKSAIAIYERLATEKPQTYNPALAASYNNLANLYRDTHRFAESEELCKSAIAIYERLATEKPQTYNPALAASYNNLALLYYDTQHFAECEAMHKSALAIRERLAKDNPQAYEPALAASYNNLANLYSDTQHFAESEAMHKSALAIRERLAKANPLAYEPALADTYNNLTALYYQTQRIVESEEMCKSALAIRERLAKANPQAYESDLAMSYNNLALLYSDTQRFAESEGMYKSALAIYERLAKANSLLYKSNRCKTLENLSFLSILTSKYADAEQYSHEAIKLDSTDHTAYTNLAAALLFQGKVKEAEELYRKYKNEFKKGFLDDFDEFAKAGVIPEERKKDVERIRKILNE